MLSILLVDDDLQFARLLFNSINDMNKGRQYFVANICTNGEEAYKYVINNRVDIILLDLNMPKLNGVDFLLKLNNSNYDNVKKVIISGDGILMRRITNENIKINSFLPKPVQFQKIYTLLENFYNEFNDYNILNIVEKYLNFFYFNKSTSGYKYIRECLYLSCKYNNLDLPLEKGLYVEVSRIFNIQNEKCVKWAIDKSIKNLCRYTADNVINKYFSDSRVTSKIFIHVISERIKIDIGNLMS